MSRPVFGVVVDAAEAATVARFLAEAVRRGQARGVPAPAEVQRLIDALDALRRARNTDGMPTVDRSGAVVEDGRSVADVAAELGISARAVRGLCQRGTLPARKGPDGQWRIAR